MYRIRYLVSITSVYQRIIIVIISAGYARALYIVRSVYTWKTAAAAVAARFNCRPRRVRTYIEYHVYTMCTGAVCTLYVCCRYIYRLLRLNFHFIIHRLCIYTVHYVIFVVCVAQTCARIYIRAARYIIRSIL